MVTLWSMILQANYLLIRNLYSSPWPKMQALLLSLAISIFYLLVHFMIRTSTLIDFILSMSYHNLIFRQFLFCLHHTALHAMTLIGNRTTYATYTQYRGLGITWARLSLVVCYPQYVTEDDVNMTTLQRLDSFCYPVSNFWVNHGRIKAHPIISTRSVIIV